MNNVNSVHAVNDVLEEKLMSKVMKEISFHEMKGLMKPLTCKNALKNMEKIICEKAFIMNDPRADDYYMHKEEKLARQVTFIAKEKA